LQFKEKVGERLRVYSKLKLYRELFPVTLPDACNYFVRSKEGSNSRRGLRWLGDVTLAPSCNALFHVHIWNRYELL
jgi:hypothetical protein